MTVCLSFSRSHTSWLSKFPFYIFSFSICRSDANQATGSTNYLSTFFFLISNLGDHLLFILYAYLFSSSKYHYRRCHRSAPSADCGVLAGLVFKTVRSENCVSIWHTIPYYRNYQKQISTLRPRQNGRHFPDDIFKCISFNENVWISIKISLKFVPKGPINNIPALLRIMAWRRPCDKRLSKPMMVRLLTHICVTRSQWVNRKPCSALAKRHSLTFKHIWAS